MNTEMYLRRHHKVVIAIPLASHQLSDAYLVAIQKNLEGLGYAFSQAALKAIGQMDELQATSFYEEVVAALKRLVGAHVRYKPMYPNFPKQVADADKVELYINAQLHYFGDWLGIRILPGYEKAVRDELADKVKLKTIELGSTDDFKSIFTLLVQSKTALSDTDKNDIKWFVRSYGDAITELLPTEIPNKENLATVAAYLLQYAKCNSEVMSKYFKTATDILRLIVAMSEGDVSLAAPAKIKSFGRAKRRMLLGLLEKCHLITEDMLRYKEQWKRVGEYLHPAEYITNFPKTVKAFEILRNDISFETFNSKLEKHLRRHEISEALVLLKTRPGELARKLDLLLRISTNHEEVLKAFKEIAPRVASTVLLQVSAHFKERNREHPIRVFFPKGNVGKAQAIKNNLPKLNEGLRQEVMVICKDALIAKYRALPRLGKVYVDRELKHFTVPFALRSASKSLRTIGRGSRLALPAGNILRFFIWWKDGIERTDLDLSALALDENSQFKMQIAYYNLKELGGYHSGDITSAPDGASEFIDIEIDKTLASGVRYIVVAVNSYTQQPFCDLPECFVGFMARQSSQSGQIYEPRTVENKVDITANTRVCLPFIIDLKDRNVIWTDLAVKNNPSYNNNVLNNMSTLTIMNMAMLSLAKPSLYDLFKLHAEARGELVKTVKDAEIIFGLKQGITPFETDKIIGEFL